MAMESILKIRAAEKQAEEIKTQAKKEAAQLLKDAREKSDKIIAESADKAASKGRDIVSEAEKLALKEVGELRRIQEKAWKDIKLKAKSRTDKAVKLIVERIVTADGHS